jgi:hypothetical protein
LAGGVNLFTYAFNNSVNNFDPDGRFVQFILPVVVYVVLPAAIVTSGIWAIERNKRILEQKDSTPPAYGSADDDDSAERVRDITRDWPWWQENFGPGNCDEEPPNEDERCRQVKDECISKCSETSLPTNDYGVSFWNCVNDCMKKNGC